MCGTRLQHFNLDNYGRQLGHTAPLRNQSGHMKPQLSSRRFQPYSCRSERAASADNQVENKNNHGNNQQQVNQAATEVHAEAQKPQNEDDYKDCPKHNSTFLILQAPGGQTLRDFRRSQSCC